MRTWLRELRQDRGITQKEMAERLNMTQQNYSMIENGVRKKSLDLFLVLKLSKILGKTVEEIISYENQ